MNWLSFFIGALAGWLVEWLMDYLLFRPRRMAADEDLRLRLATVQKESASLRAQLQKADRPANQAPTQVSRQMEIEAGLASSRAEVESLRSKLAGTQEMQASLASAKADADALKAQLAAASDLQGRLDSSEAAAHRYKLENERLQAELAAARPATASQSAAAGAALPAMENFERGTKGEGPAIPIEPMQPMEHSAATAPSAATAVTQPAIDVRKPENLDVIEGIGPKIAELLKQNDIHTFAQLAGTSIDRLRSILAAGGPRFSMADPSTWAEQAMLARDGKWDALKDLQNNLRGGRHV
jgi:predicted flap endonuclease-1-like 5' DNA nuclease